MQEFYPQAKIALSNRIYHSQKCRQQYNRAPYYDETENKMPVQILKKNNLEKGDLSEATATTILHVYMKIGDSV
jgi:hypothetical protein